MTCRWAALRFGCLCEVGRVPGLYDNVAEVLRWVDHALVETDEDACTIRLQADKLDWLVMAVVRIALHAPVNVIEPMAVTYAVDRLGQMLNPSGP